MYFNTFTVMYIIDKCYFSVLRVTGYLSQGHRSTELFFKLIFVFFKTSDMYVAHFATENTIT